MADYMGDPRQAPPGTLVQMWGGVDPVYAEGNGKFYQVKNGQKQYVPGFVVMQGYHPGTEFDATGQLTPQAQQERSAQNVPGASLFHNRGEFNPETGDYDQSINWGNILSMGIGGTMAAPFIAGALGGGAGAGAGAGTDAAVTSAAAAGTGPATVGAAIPTTMGIGSATSLGLPVTAGFGTAGGATAAATIPTTLGIDSATSLGLPTTEGLGTAGGASALAGGAATGIPNGYPGSEGYAPGNTFPNGIPNAASGLFGLDPKWSNLIKALAGVGGMVGGNALANSGAQNAVPPQLSQLLDLSMNRANSQTPLFNAVNKGYYDMLPNFAKTGGQ